MLFKPISGKFKDYIASPKPNMYQSLHTSVIGLDGNIYEIQIRTKEMDEVAERGVAAHWRYKEGNKIINNSQKLIEEQLHWFKDYVSINEMNEKSDQYVDSLKKDIFEANIYTMSPKGRVISFPKSFNPVDFAYRININVGHMCVGALVNGVMVSLNTILKTGDVVEIKTSKLHSFPSEGWLQFVKTSFAKNQIKRALSKKNQEEFREELINRGKELLDEDLRNRKVNDKEAYSIINTPDFLKIFTSNKLEELFINIANRNVNTTNVIDKLKSKLQINSIPKFEFKNKNPKKTNSNGIIVDGIENIKVTLSQCCSPIPGDDIVGFISRGNGIRVHRKDCSTIEHENSRLIDVKWDEEISKNMLHQADIIIRAQDRNNLLVEIINYFSLMKVSIASLNAVNNKNTLISSFQLSIMIRNKEHFNTVYSGLKNINGVIDIERVTRN